MVHGMFYAVLLGLFMAGIGLQWVYRAYFNLLIFVHSIEIMFLGVLSWYSFGNLVFLPLTGLWLVGMGSIYLMNRFA